MPAAIDTMFCSATPTLKNRVGCLAAKSTVRFACARSAVSTTIRGSESPRSARVSPATNAGMLVAEIPLPVPFSLGTSAAAALPRKTSLISWPTASSRAPSAIGAVRDERTQPALDLGNHVVVVLANEIADMPLVVALHAPHTAALHRVGNHHLRRADARWVQRIEDVEDRIEVVSVDLVDLPAEALEARR